MTCPKCDMVLMAKWECEENLVRVQTNDVVAPPGRNFRAKCPVHGEFIHQDLKGHHSDIRTMVRRRYKRKLALLKSSLTGEDMERFLRAYDGKHYPTEADLEHWDSLVRDSKD